MKATRGSRDRGSVLTITLAFIVLASVVGAATSAFAVASFREASLRNVRLRDLRAADGAMRIAVEKLRSPQTVVLASTTAGSTTLTASQSAFRPDDVGEPISADTLEEGTVIAGYLSATRVTLSDPALVTSSSTVVEFGDVECPTEPTRLLQVVIDGITTTVDCAREPTVPGQFGQPALVVTGPDGLEVKEEPNVFSGDVYFTQPSSISLGKKVVIEDGDVWYPASACPASAPSIAKLTFAVPSAQQYTCVETSATDKISDLLDAPILPALPGTAPASVVVDKCRVYSPGRYTTSNRPDFEGEKNVYLRSGVYYFDNLGEVKVKNTIVTGGRPGDALAADDGEALWNLPCDSAAASPAVGDTGAGVTIVLGGTSRIKIEDKGGLELFEPATGSSVVGLAAPTNGYAATTGGSATTPQIDQRPGGSALRIHGRVWLPTGYMALGSAAAADKTADGQAPLGGQLLGGTVVYRLEMAKKPPAGGYNLQSAHLDIIQRVLLVATAGSIGVRVVAEVRPAGDELAVVSWQESRDTTIVAAQAQSLLSRPELAAESDSGLRDRVLTNSVTPLFSGDAPTGSEVRIFVDDVQVGSATALNREYLVRSSTLREGDHLVRAVSRDAAGRERSTLPRTITIDRTPPAVGPADVAIVPLSNVRGSLHLGRSVAFYVYAKAVDPAGISSVVVDVSSIVAGSTAVPLIAGEYVVDGVSYGWRSPLFGTPSKMTTTAKSIEVRATDAAANTSAPRTTTISVDITAPTVSLTSPASNAVLTAPTTLSAVAADASPGVDNVRFEYSVSGKKTWSVIGTVSSAPFTMAWDPSALAKGTYDVRAVALDRAGNAATSSTVKVRTT